MSDSQQDQAPAAEAPREIPPAPAPREYGRVSPEEYAQLMSKAAEAPAIAPDEFESWPDWNRTGVALLGMTLLEVVCLLLYNADFFVRISAASADGFGAHFPGWPLLSMLIALGSGAFCAFGMLRHIRWVKGLTEMRISLGVGQVIVYLLLSELVISDQPWRIVPFILLLGAMVFSYICLGKTRQSFFRA